MRTWPFGSGRVILIMSDIITHNAKPGLSTKGIPNLELILFKSRPKCLHLVGYPGLIFDQAFDFQVLIGLLYPPSDCQPLKLLGKVTNWKCKWDKSRMQFCSGQYLLEYMHEARLGLLLLGTSSLWCLTQLNRTLRWQGYLTFEFISQRFFFLKLFSGAKLIWYQPLSIVPKNKNVWPRISTLKKCFSCRTEEHNSWILNLINCCGVNSIFWPGSIKFCLQEQFSILRKPRTFG